MKINFYFQQTDKTCEKQVNEYFTEEKLNRLTNLLHHGNLELAILDVRIEYFSHHNDYVAKLNMTVGKREFIGEKRGFSLIESLDIALDNLVSQLRKLESIRHDK
ncbi:MAG: HPF/RaiA family ribosome-associated protein [Patescibacteria group bacterium]